MSEYTAATLTIFYSLHGLADTVPEELDSFNLLQCVGVCNIYHSVCNIYYTHCNIYYSVCNIYYTHCNMY